MSIANALFAKAKADINEIFDPAKVPGSSVYTASNGTDLGMQAIFAGSFFAIFILLFSALRLRWPFIFSPRTRLTITAPPFLSRRFFGWLLATMRTPETHILNTLGLDSVIFLRFYKMCTRLLLDVAFFSIVIIWPLNIRWSKANLNPQTNGNNAVAGEDTDGDLPITLTYSVTDYVFNLTLNTADPKQKLYLVPHIVFVYLFSGLAYYHISKFSSRWASLRWHFLMQSRHARVSRTVMLTGVPRHLASSPRELEWFCGPGLQLGKVEQVRVCPYNTRLTSTVRERAKYLIRLEQAYMKVLGNPCVHPDYDPEKLRALAMDPSDDARVEERRLLEQWARPSAKRRKGTKSKKLHMPFMNNRSNASVQPSVSISSALPSTAVMDMSDGKTEKVCTATVHIADGYKGIDGASNTSSSGNSSSSSSRTSQRGDQLVATGEQTAVRRPTVWVRSEPHRLWKPLKRVDAIDHWRTEFLKADHEIRQLRDTLNTALYSEISGNAHGQASSSDGANCGHSTTAFVTFEDAASAHMMTQLACYPNPGFMKAKLAPEPRGVYWPNIWLSNRRKWLGFTLKWLCIFVIWAFWTVPVILFSSLLTPASLGKIFPSLLRSDHNLLRSFLSSTVPSVFLLLFLNMLPWILKQVHFVTGMRTKPDIDYSVMTKMWAFLVFNVILIFGLSGTFWDQILNVVNNPGSIMQNLASNIPRVGTFFTGYILVLGVGYQPFKLLQLRPVIWHIGRQWLCNTPRDYARLVSPVYIDWYSVYPYPLLVFAIAMIYSTFSPPVVIGAIIYFIIGYPVMKYLLLYVYFHPFETAGMAWPKVCRRMIFSIILYQVVILTFVIVKGGGWYTFSMVPIILIYLWFFYHVGWSLEKQGTVLPLYLWRHPPPNSAYPLPPDSINPEDDDGGAENQSHVMADNNYDTMPPMQAVRGEVLVKHDPLVDMDFPNDGGIPTPISRPKRSGSSYLAGVNRSYMRPPPAPQPYSSTSSPGVQTAGNRVIKRSATQQHRRESSRSIRTREIILAGRSPARWSGPGSGRKRPTRPSRSFSSIKSPTRNTESLQLLRTSTTPVATADRKSRSATSARSAGLLKQVGQRRVHNALSPGSGTGSGRTSILGRHRHHSPHWPVMKRRKRYKSLAEAATAEGSRLIMSLGRIPSELYSRRAESKRNSLGAPSGDRSAEPVSGSGKSIGLVGAKTRRWSFSADSLQGPHGKRRSSKLAGSDQRSKEYQSIRADSGVRTNPRVPAQHKSQSSSYLIQPHLQLANTRVHMRSPLSRELSPPQQPSSRAILSGTTRLRCLESHSTHAHTSDEDDNGDDDGDGEWVDDEAELSLPGVMASTSAPEGTAWRNDGQGAQNWDELVYLKSSSSESRSPQRTVQDPQESVENNGSTLGTLLTNLDRKKSTSFAAESTDLEAARVRLPAVPIQQLYATGISANGHGSNPASTAGLRRRHQRRHHNQSHSQNQSQIHALSQSQGNTSLGNLAYDSSLLSTDADGGNGGSSIGDAVAASIINAERSPEYEVPNAPASNSSENDIGSNRQPRRAVGLARRVRGTLQRMRDYFLADFRPAGPILDLTYDRLYSQGLEDTMHGRMQGNGYGDGQLAEDNGDTLPPLSQILGRVLPRSMSRTFNQGTTAQPDSTAATAAVAATDAPGIVSSLTAPPGAMAAATAPPMTMPESSSSVSSQSPPPGLRLRSATSPLAEPRDKNATADSCRRRAWGPSLAQVLAESGENNLHNRRNSSGADDQATNMRSTMPMVSLLTRKSLSPTSTGLQSYEQYGMYPEELPRPPRAPWLLSSMEHQQSPPLGHGRSASQPPLTQGSSSNYQRMSNISSGGEGGASNSIGPGLLPDSLPGSSAVPAPLTSLGSRRASHKNSLPPPRARLPARMVSELNYVSRHSATPSGSIGANTWSMPGQRQEPTDPAGQMIRDSETVEGEESLLIANYQRFALEAQSTFEPDEFTDYSQTPMLNFRGILDRGIRDYVHPGLVGELPTLWLPVKRVERGEQEQHNYEGSVHSNRPEDIHELHRTPDGEVRAAAMHNPLIALAAPRGIVRRLVSQLGYDGGDDSEYKHHAVAANSSGDHAGNSGDGANLDEQDYYVNDREFLNATMAGSHGSGDRQENRSLQKQGDAGVHYVQMDEAYSELPEAQSPHNAEATALTPIMEEATPRSPVAIVTPHSHSHSHSHSPSSTSSDDKGSGVGGSGGV
ncbi:hypothetical protein GGI07_001965 [Coemansia sp. Benny D115]|nr:hypothetical protein GGI07_001965 [Coemansia sp. Benny D115]